MSQQFVLLECASTTMPDTIDVKNYQHKPKPQNEDLANISIEKSKNQPMPKLNLNLVLKQKVRPSQCVPFDFNKEIEFVNKMKTKKRSNTLSQTQISEFSNQNSKSQCESQRSKSILRKRRTMNSEGNHGRLSKNVHFGSEITPLTQIIPVESSRQNYSEAGSINKPQKEERIDCRCCCIY